MTTRSIHDTIRLKRVMTIQTVTSTGSPNEFSTGAIDLKGYDSALFLVDFGDIDEMGGSPVGSAKIDIRVEHAPDSSGSPGTFAAVAATDIDGLTPSSGIVASPTTDANEVTFGYIGSKRWVRVTLVATALPNGGPAGVWMANGHAHLSPVTQG
jgi:hypothetical protein